MTPLEFLKQHKYTIDVKEVKGGIEISLPEIKTKFLNKPPSAINYCIRRGKNTKVSRKDTGEVVKVPEYAIRLYTSCLILKHCIDIGYNFDYIQVFNKAGKEIGVGLGFVEKIIKPPKALEKEQDLVDVFNKCNELGLFESFEKMAKEKNVEDAFNLIKELF